MDFSQTMLFVVPSSNSLPTTGSNAALTANQFGIFRDDYSAATAGNIAAAKWIFVSQGYPQVYPGMGTKNSDKIYFKNLVEHYKVAAETTASVQITDISDFTAVCGETVTISLRLRSFYLDTAVAGGLTKSFTLPTPCCDCGDNPCENVDAEALVDDFVTAINADTRNTLGIGNFIIAERIGSGDSSKLRLVGIPLTAEGASCDPTVNPYQYDRMYFWGFAYKGPATSQDYNIWNICDPFATVATVQESTYLTNSSDQILQMERDYWTYSVPPIAKPLYSNVNFNNGYTSQVEDGVFYDLYYIKFQTPQSENWNVAIDLDETVIIAIPTGEGTTIETILEVFLGAFTDDSPEDISTTTTTTSTTTTSTSTTTTTTSSTTTTTTTI